MVDKKTAGKIVGGLALLGAVGGLGYIVGRNFAVNSILEKYNSELNSKSEEIEKLKSQLENVTKEKNKLAEKIGNLESQLANYKNTGLSKIFLPYGIVTLHEGDLPYKVFAECLNKGLDNIATKPGNLTIVYNGKQIEINNTFSGTVLADAIAKELHLNYTGLEKVIGKIPINEKVAKIHEIRILNEESGEYTTLDNIVKESDIIPKSDKFILTFDTSKGEYKIEVSSDNMKTIAYLMKAENEARLIEWKDNRASYDLKHLQEFASKAYDLAIVEMNDGSILLGLTKTYKDLQGVEKSRGIIAIPGKIIEAPYK